MNGISKRITHGSGFSKALPVIRKELVCFKESKELFSDAGLHCFRDK